MKKVIIILCAVFLAICVLLAVLAPDFLSMLIIGIMAATIAAGLVFGIIPNLLYCEGFKTGQDSIDLSREVNADNVWTAVTSVKPFFRQKRLDEMFDTYMDMVRDQEEKGVVISDIEDVINDETLAIHSWRGVVLQISGILTALGLLGTFLGLVTGISTVAFTTAEATMESIENLLEQGISTAFYTSIAGVILSILFNIAYRLVWNIMLRDYQLFTEQFHVYIQPSADEQIRAKQYLNTEKMIETLNVIRTNSTMSLSRENVDPAQEQRMMIDILSGLRHGEFTFMLEPVCNLSDRNVIKAECKLQWNHPVLGWVQPSVYLPIVESDGFIAKLDQHIWDQVCSKRCATGSTAAFTPSPSCSTSAKPTFWLSTRSTASSRLSTNTGLNRATSRWLSTKAPTSSATTRQKKPKSNSCRTATRSTSATSPATLLSSARSTPTKSVSTLTRSQPTAT